MATIPVANARIDALDATHWHSAGSYIPEAQAFPFRDVPASHAAGANARKSARRAKALKVCPTCFIASCDEH